MSAENRQCGSQPDAVSESQTQPIGLAAHVALKLHWEELLAKNEAEAQRESARLRENIRKEAVHIALLGSGFDEAKIAVAETFLSAGIYAQGGEDRRSVLDDAIKWFAGVQAHSNLRREYFGTKKYDRWDGQRSDHSYGFGPKHGSICFSVGLRAGFRDAEFTQEQKDAAIYYLMNLPMIQKCAQEVSA